MKELTINLEKEANLPAGSGQVHCGKDRMANVGVRKENVPP